MSHTGHFIKISAFVKPPLYQNRLHEERFKLQQQQISRPNRFRPHAKFMHTYKKHSHTKAQVESKGGSLLRQRAMGSSTVAASAGDFIVSAQQSPVELSWVAPLTQKRRCEGPAGSETKESKVVALKCVLPSVGNSSDCKSRAMHRGTAWLD